MVDIKRIWLTLALYLLGLVVVLMLTFFLGSRISHKTLQQQAQLEADNLSQYISNELTRFQNIPQLLASNYLIRRGIIGDADSDELNHLLLDISQSSGADDIYVMNQKGIVIAASNYQLQQSFITGDFAFRPYFKQAITGHSNAYYALGLRSHERGVFFSAPISINKQVVGVITVKVAVAKFEQDTELLAGDRRASFMAYGDDNVVFISNVAHWRLKQLAESEETTWSQIITSRRYLDLSQQSLPNAQKKHRLHGTPLWLIEPQRAKAEQQPSKSNRLPKKARHFFGQANIPLLNLNLVILLPYNGISQAQMGNMLLVGVLYLLVVALAVFIYRRLAGYNRLLFTRNSLEREVALRSKELADAQDALIRAAKLTTIGQLSASINHEINQPLSAINTYLVSSRRMLDKGMLDKAKANLVTIESLVERVHKIVAQLKQFSRAEGNTLQATALEQCIENALVIVGPKIKSQSVDLSIAVDNVAVWVESLKFEQVLVNLLSNAVDAMQETPHKTLGITSELLTDTVIIRIKDSGPGLDLQTIDTIFEPFFTTKSSHGLGLGLSISRNIIHSFQGELMAENNSEGGAVFTLKLKRDLT